MSIAPSDRNPSERLTRWVREHGGAVRAYLWTVLRDEHAADDLVQEVFYRAWTARGRYRDDGRERSYLLRIADRLACDRLRQRVRERRATDDLSVFEPAAGGPTPDVDLLRDEAKRQLNDALEQLSEPQRRTLLLRYFGDLEFHEIGALLGAPLNTVLSHGRRGLLALRKLLTEKTT